MYNVGVGVVVGEVGIRGNMRDLQRGIPLHTRYPLYFMDSPSLLENLTDAAIT